MKNPLEDGRTWPLEVLKRERDTYQRQVENLESKPRQGRTWKNDEEVLTFSRAVVTKIDELLAAPAEGEALQRLIADMRDTRRRWRPQYGGSDVVYGDKVDEWADELEAALAPLAGPVDASGEPQRLVKAARWAEQQLNHLVSDDDGDGAFIRGTGTELAGFGAGMEELRFAIRAAAAAVPSSPAQEPTWFCKGCPETFTSSNVAAEHSRATYHVITSNPLERVFVTESEVAPASSPVADSPTWQPMETLPKDRWVWVMFGTKNPEIAALQWNTRMSMWQSGTGYWDTPMPFTGWSEMGTQPASAPSPSAGAAQEPKP